MVVTVDTFIVHLFRKVCSACLVKSWQTGNENFQIRRCLFGDWLKNELFYWVRVEEIFLMKIRPSPFHSPFRAYCSHKVDPHLRLCALRLHVSINNSKLILIYNMYIVCVFLNRKLIFYVEQSDNDTNKKRENEKNSSFQLSITPNSCISMRRSLYFNKHCPME
ncbi:hypothetical protein T4D_9756 [Trichinella pseudospiralis]|uniref:Uncharacterized protein n=1 Tax=Trichinella pseudospiralis TaxID=6337 RepID=A0A0V1G255_TRIPS|nr:hypothetical protein T4D_9756 [Trichinella pseudospiralis]